MLIAELETPNLIIRDVRESDADAFYAYMQREAYWRDLPIDPPTPEWVANMVNRRLQDQTKEPRTSYFLAATDKATGTVVGDAGLYIRSASSRQGEVGWVVRPYCRGRGLGTEIRRAMLDLAFGSLNLHRVYAQCRVENRASRRIMEKLRMREEGILRENVFARGLWWSSVQCSILAAEYAARDA